MVNFIREGKVNWKKANGSNVCHLSVCMQALSAYHAMFESFEPCNPCASRLVVYIHRRGRSVAYHSFVSILPNEAFIDQWIVGPY